MKKIPSCISFLIIWALGCSGVFPCQAQEPLQVFQMQKYFGIDVPDRPQDRAVDVCR